MTRDEWASLVPVISDRWIGVDEADALAWFDLLDDLDGGQVTEALMRLADAGESPTATSIRRSVNHLVRERAEAAPHPASAGFITFAEWLRRGCPGYLDEEPDREKVRMRALEAVPGRIVEMGDES